MRIIKWHTLLTLTVDGEASRRTVEAILYAFGYSDKRPENFSVKLNMRMGKFSYKIGGTPMQDLLNKIDRLLKEKKFFWK